MTVRAKVRVLFRDPRWLALEKPAGMLTVPSGSAREEDTLFDRARLIASGATHHHALSRLDAGVTGVVVFALTPEASDRANHGRARGLRLDDFGGRQRIGFRAERHGQHRRQHAQEDHQGQADDQLGIEMGGEEIEVLRCVGRLVLGAAFPDSLHP